MNRRQRTLLTESSVVLAVTVLAVIGLIHLKDHINRSEAMRAMDQLGRHILEYRGQYGSLPAESFVTAVKGQVEGAVRLGNIRYRALWIGQDAPPDTILAYSYKRYRTSFLKDGCVVLRLDGTVEWMAARRFRGLFAAQRAFAEPNAPM